MGKRQEDEHTKEEVNFGAHLSLPLEFQKSPERGWGVDGEREGKLPLIRSPLGELGGWETEYSAALECDYVMRIFHFNLDFHRDCQRAIQRSLA